MARKKNTPNKKSSPKKNPASGLVRNSKLRSRLWKLERDKFKTYADTAKAASYLINKQKAEGVRGKMPNSFIQAGTTSYITTRLAPIKPILAPEFTEGFQFFEIDEKMEELLTAYPDKSIHVRSIYSDRRDFPLRQYKYEETFKSYVDQENGQEVVDSNGTDYFITIEYDPQLKTYYLWLHQEDEQIEESDAEEDIPSPTSTIEGTEEESEGEEEIEEEAIEKEQSPQTGLTEEKYVSRDKSLDLKYREIDFLNSSMKILEDQRDLQIRNLREYKELGLKKEFNKASKELAVLNDSINKLNRRIIALTQS